MENLTGALVIVLVAVVPSAIAYIVARRYIGRV